MWTSPSFGMNGPAAGTARDPRFKRAAMTVPYAELHLKSFYSFGVGASHTHEMLAQARELRLWGTGPYRHQPLRGIGVRPACGQPRHPAHNRWRVGAHRRGTACAPDQEP